MILTSERCVIRSWSRDDVAELALQANDPGIAANLRDSFPHPYTRGDAQQWIDQALAETPETSFGIEVAGKLVGSIGLRLQQGNERNSAEIGYWLGRAYWGQGLATEALRCFTTFAFDPFHLSRLFALPFADNRASCRVLEKAGYRLVGILHQSIIKAGVIHDQAMYERIREGISSRRV